MRQKKVTVTLTKYNKTKTRTTKEMIHEGEKNFRGAKFKNTK